MKPMRGTSEDHAAGGPPEQPRSAIRMWISYGSKKRLWTSACLSSTKRVKIRTRS